MNPYIGDRQLEPGEDPEVCEWCEGNGFVYDDDDNQVDCGSCDAPYDPDPGEPQDYPEE